MLAAAGLSATWLFAKAHILAIFDDVDTVLLMIPLLMLIVGLAAGGVVALMGPSLGGLALPAPLSVIPVKWLVAGDRPPASAELVASTHPHHQN